MVRLLVVDDHEVVRAGLRSLLEDACDIQVVDGAATGAEAVAAVARHNPDVVLLDVRLPDESGIKVCQQIRERWPAVQVLILTSYPEREVVMGAITAGAAGFLLKGVRAEALAEAVRTVARGGSLLDPEITRQVLDRVRAGRNTADPMTGLTAQETSILRLVAGGHTNREIGQQMYLSEKTVKHYVSIIFQKMGVSRRAEAAAILARSESGLATLGQR